MGPTILFTHLKIILLQYFQFLVFNFSKISFIQTDLKSEGLTVGWYFRINVIKSVPFQPEWPEYFVPGCNPER